MIDYTIAWSFGSICLAAIVSYSSYPMIIKVSKLKQLMDEPGHRSSHAVKTPNLGGVGIFLGVITVLTFVGSLLSYNNLLCLIGALIVLFFTGLKDDLVEISPIKKMAGQIVASLCVICITDLRIHSFFGLFGIAELPYIASIIVTLFTFIVVINAFNLIDGVDGLAASLAIVASAILAILFYINGNDSMLFIALSLIGSLSSFLFFNFSKSKKVFMGDTGSMIIGFLMAYLGVSFLHQNHPLESLSFMQNAPLFVIAIFSFPLMDTLRVFIIRISQRKSPFVADKNHIHHNLLALGFAHWQIAVTASVFVIAMAVMTYNLNGMDMHLSFLILIAVTFVFSVAPHMLLKVTKQNKNYKNTYLDNYKVFKNADKNPNVQ